MKQFTLNHGGTDLVVEVDQGALFWNRVRLISDDEVVDERNLFLGKTRLRAPRPRPAVVEVKAGFFGVKKAWLLDGDRKVRFIKG